VSTEIAELSQLEDLERLSELLATIWGRSTEPPLNTDILKALAMSQNYIAGAFVEGRLIGGLVGWLGGTPPDELQMHSHILGVLPNREKQGLGFELKQHQRRWCLARGVKVVEWTTDPLIPRNVYFNLTKLGAEAPDYLVNLYGQMRDGINAGEESDRLLIRWRLDSDRAEAAARGELREPDIDDLRQGNAGAILSVGGGGEPVSGAIASRVLICQVPGDIVEVRRSDPALAREWRLALRAAMKRAIAAGFAVTGATRSGWYVLESITS
jgi:predicted GNAT superfamily acetyltransferase